VSNDVRVKVRQLDSLGEVLDQVVGQGANHVQGITFSVAEPTPVLDDLGEGRAVAEAGDAGPRHPLGWPGRVGRGRRRRLRGRGLW
jgi:hypothetical protein